MEFRTPLHIPPSPFRISHDSRILTLGSCFSNVIGEKLRENKFHVKVNPFGVIFNPFSILKTLEAAAENTNLFAESAIQNNAIWYNYDLHSDFSADKKEMLEEKTAGVLSDVHAYIAGANAITLTFGTAFVYRLKKIGKIVANCHKVPAGDFTKSLLETQEIVQEFERVYTLIKKINPSIQFILTVSPVRHIKDGIEQNSVSKSVLRSACHLICSQLKDVDYFPAYEIMMDDLRDYRFYKKDMIHPSSVAEEYIWEKFIEKYIPNKSQDLIKEWQVIRKAMEHKPFHPGSDAYRKFLKETIAKLEKLKGVVNVEKELKELERKLTSS